MIAFIRDVKDLLVRKSRTAWSVVLTTASILLTEVDAVKTLLGSYGVKPVYLAFIGLAAILYARRNDYATGRNPQ